MICLLVFHRQGCRHRQLEFLTKVYVERRVLNQIRYYHMLINLNIIRFLLFFYFLNYEEGKEIRECLVNSILNSVSFGSIPDVSLCEKFIACSSWLATIVRFRM